MKKVTSSNIYSCRISHILSYKYFLFFFYNKYKIMYGIKLDNNSRGDKYIRKKTGQH